MQLKGCQKRIVCMKNMDGSLFDEAFFIMKEDAPQAEDGDMLAEANRLLSQNLLARPERDAARPHLARLAFFLFGALASALLCFLYLVLCF